MTIHHDIVYEFAAIFAGRTDAHGSWTGGKLNGPPDYLAHLMFGPHVGVYPLRDDNTVRWGCVDIDGKDFDGDWERMWTVANDLTDALAYKNCTAWTERTANGIHVWVFADAFVPAATMRRALLAACEVIEYRPREVNPKQETVTVDKPLGNYVRLPYYGYLADGMPKDRYVIDEDGPLALEQWCQAVQGSLTDEATLHAMAVLHTPPVQVSADVDTSTSTNIDNLYPILPPVVRAIYDDGPLNGDRSSAIVKAAVIMRDDGWQAQAMYQVLDAIDMRLGKFVGRDDREQQLLAIIEKVT